ncbi:MAG: hypothetical protein NVS4B2_15060 [Chloroflexota bacterium]
MQSLRNWTGPSLAGVAILSGVVALAVPSGPRATADDSSPTPVVQSPEATAAIATPEVAATGYPTVAAERSTPVVVLPTPTSSAAQPVVTSAPVPVRVHVHVIPATATPFPLDTSPTNPGAVPAPSASGIYVPLPSPAELRRGARLHWGTRAPARVRRWAFLIVPAARRYGLDPNLVAAVMTMESNGDPLAWSGADARGLMQVLHGPWDPRENVFMGVRMLAGFLADFHTVPLALAAYNAGPGAVQQYNGVPPYRETRDYVIVVSYLYDLFSQHRLSVARKEVFKRTLHDLTHFADQRKKVSKLAAIAHIRRDPVLLCDKKPDLCLSVEPSISVPAPVVQNHDPFWPLAGLPDPLQRVDPYAVTQP